jgi:hypothetical protein
MPAVRTHRKVLLNLTKRMRRQSEERAMGQLSKSQNPDAIKLHCPRCDKADGLRIGQLNFRGQLRWFESVNCDQCGLRSEADGVGFPPSQIREWLIKHNGEWSVMIGNVRSKASTVKVLRAALSLDMKTAAALVESESTIVFKGSKAESLWLVELLEASGDSPILLMTESNS